MLIGEAVLKSTAFSPRLVMLLEELRAAGYTVWLEGLRLRFDRPDASGDEDDLRALFGRYRDVAEWLPEPKAEPALRSPAPVLPRWRGFRRAEAEAPSPAATQINLKRSRLAWGRPARGSSPRRPRGSSR